LIWRMTRYGPSTIFCRRTNWMNDPNGPLWWKGQYHLFYQPIQVPFSGAKQWGHAVSEDMLQLAPPTDCPHPTPGGPDGDGC